MFLRHFSKNRCSSSLELRPVVISGGTFINHLPPLSTFLFSSHTLCCSQNSVPLFLQLKEIFETKCKINWECRHRTPVTTIWNLHMHNIFLSNNRQTVCACKSFFICWILLLKYSSKFDKSFQANDVVFLSVTCIFSQIMPIQPHFPCKTWYFFCIKFLHPSFIQSVAFVLLCDCLILCALFT